MDGPLALKPATMVHGLEVERVMIRNRQMAVNIVKVVLTKQWHVVPQPAPVRISALRVQ